MTAVADRRRAFAWLDLEALERIDAHAPESVAAGVHNVYLALARMAARRFDGEHDGFEATRGELAGLARTSTKTIDRHVAELERLGLVDVERRQSTSGSPLPSRYVLVDPPAEAPGVETQRLGVARVATPSRHPGDTGAAPVSPHRARLDAVKEKEEGERERERAQEEIAPGIGAGSEAEQAVAAELGALLADRGQSLSARDRLAIRSAVHATPEGVDPVAAAARIRANYGSDGKAVNRRIGNVVAVLVAEIEQSSARRPAPQRAAGRQSSRRNLSPESTSARAERLAGHLRIHETRPPVLDPPSRRLSSAWDQVRERLHSRYGGLWAHIHSIDLAGTLTTLVTDSDGEIPQLVIVLDASPDQVDAVSGHGKRITGLFEQALEVEGAIVEIAPSMDREEGACSFSRSSAA